MSQWFSPALFGAAGSPKSRAYLLAVVLTVLPVAGVADEATNASLVELGEKLFRDEKLSADGKISCQSCHRPELAFTDGLATARGAHGRLGTRNTPSLLNVASHPPFFWDGRRPTLESQSTEPFLTPEEHGIADERGLLDLVRRDESYGELVRRAYGKALEKLNIADVRSALVGFMKSLIAFDSPFDRFLAGEVQALSVEQRRGLQLFEGRARCSQCHQLSKPAPLLTDNQFHALGADVSSHARLAELSREVMRSRDDRLPISARPDIAALGRFVVTKNPRDIGKFKTPSLRNVAVTGPYMHDGSVATLREAVEREIYYRSQADGAPAIFTPDEKNDIVTFLTSLTGEQYRSRRTADWETRAK